MADAALLSCAQIARAVRTGERRAADIVSERLLDIAARDSGIGAFVETFGARAIAEAEEIDRVRASGRSLPPLAGVPIAIKDNFLLEGQIAACGSKMLASFRAPCTATVVARLRDLGAVVVGRTNMDEFGMGSSTERSAFFPTKNPWDRSRVPGGSSGGAAAAVAADLCPLALGSDTGGSVRQPAALCGVTGLKPTYGRLSRHGLVAYASSLDCPGFLARTAEELALAMQVAGIDPHDATTFDAKASECELTAGHADASRLRIGVLRDDAIDRGIDAEIGTSIDEALKCWGQLGAKVASVALPHARHAIAAYYLVASAEASSNLARYDGIRYGHSPGGRTIEAAVTRARSEGFGPEVQLRILLGAHALQHGYHDELYGHATRVRRLVAADFAAAFAHCDVVAMPTAPAPAFLLGSRVDDPVAMYACDALTVPASLAGLPAISFPCGFTKGGLPIGMQFVAPPRREGLLLAAAHAWQLATDWHQRRPAR